MGQVLQWAIFCGNLAKQNYAQHNENRFYRFTSAVVLVYAVLTPDFGGR
jgi:hypothetical protein